MSDIGDDIFFRIGGILHEARMEECYGKMNVSSRKKWPETFKDFRRQRMDGQPWIDVAIAQVRALVKNALLAQRIEHEPSKLGVEGSNPSERTNEVRAPRPKISPPSDPIYCNLDEAKWCRCVVRCDDCPTLALTRPASNSEAK